MLNHILPQRLDCRESTTTTTPSAQLLSTWTLTGGAFTFGRALAAMTFDTASFRVREMLGCLVLSESAWRHLQLQTVFLIRLVMLQFHCIRGFMYWGMTHRMLALPVAAALAPGALAPAMNVLHVPKTTLCLPYLSL